MIFIVSRLMRNNTNTGVLLILIAAVRPATHAYLYNIMYHINSQQHCCVLHSMWTVVVIPSIIRLFRDYVLFTGNMTTMLALSTIAIMMVCGIYGLPAR